MFIEDMFLFWNPDLAEIYLFLNIDRRRYWVERQLTQKVSPVSLIKLTVMKTINHILGACGVDIFCYFGSYLIIVISSCFDKLILGAYHVDIYPCQVQLFPLRLWHLRRVRSKRSQQVIYHDLLIVLNGR